MMACMVEVVVILYMVGAGMIICMEIIKPLA